MCSSPILSSGGGPNLGDVLFVSTEKSGGKPNLNKSTLMVCCGTVLKSGIKPNLGDVLCYNIEAWYKAQPW
jgi:hypothetical protein